MRTSLPGFEPSPQKYSRMSSISVRPLEAKDSTAWAAMRAALWPEADAGDLQREADAFVAGDTLPTVTVAFIAVDDDRPIGFLDLSVRAYANGCDSMPVPFIEGWYVVSSARGLGVGRALIRAAEEWSRARRYAEIGSDTQIWNEDSLQAHQQCGFEETQRVIYLRKKLS
jgi:aminoglycoside 6'-N-acetyltransferase I